MLAEAEPQQKLENIEAEAALIGALLIDGKIADRVTDFVTEDDFAEPLHGRLFRHITQIAARGETPNPMLIKPFFEADPAFNDVGGMGYFAALTTSNVSVIAAKSFAEQIAELAQRRRLIEQMQLAIGALSQLDGTTTITSVIEQLEHEITPVAFQKSSTIEGDMSFFAQQAIEAWEQPDARIRCSIVPSFDDGIGSFMRGNMLVLAGRPGMGKTAVALSIARGFATNGHGTCIISREMRGAELAERAISDMSFDSMHPIAYGAITNGRLGMDQKRAACRVQGEMTRLPLSIIDTPSMKTGELSRRIRRWKRRCVAKGVSPDVVIVDYLQLLDPDHRTNGQTEKISEISMALKSIAKEHDVGVIALSQLSRAVESRDNKRPQLSDLRDSGQIEQDADAVLFLYRHEYYLRQLEPKKDDVKRDAWEQALQDCQDKIELIFGKVRKGVPSTRVAEFHGAYQAVRG